MRWTPWLMISRECSARNVTMSVTEASKGRPRSLMQSRCSPLVITCCGAAGTSPCNVGNANSAISGTFRQSAGGARGSRLRFNTWRHRIKTYEILQGSSAISDIGLQWNVVILLVTSWQTLLQWECPHQTIHINCASISPWFWQFYFIIYMLHNDSSNVKQINK